MLPLFSVLDGSWVKNWILIFRAGLNLRQLVARSHFWAAFEE